MKIDLNNYIEVKALTQAYCDHLIDQANLSADAYRNSPKFFDLKPEFATGSRMLFFMIGRAHV